MEYYDYTAAIAEKINDLNVPALEGSKATNNGTMGNVRLPMHINDINDPKVEELQNTLVEHKILKPGACLTFIWSRDYPETMHAEIRMKSLVGGEEYYKEYFANEAREPWSRIKSRGPEASAHFTKLPESVRHLELVTKYIDSIRDNPAAKLALISRVTNTSEPSATQTAVQNLVKQHHGNTTIQNSYEQAMALLGDSRVR